MPPFFRQLTKTDLGCEWRRCHETPWCTLFSMTSSKVASHIGTKFFWNRIYFPNFQCSFRVESITCCISSWRKKAVWMQYMWCDYACFLKSCISSWRKKLLSYRIWTRCGDREALVAAALCNTALPVAKSTLERCVTNNFLLLNPLYYVLYCSCLLLPTNRAQHQVAGAGGSPLCPVQ